MRMTPRIHSVVSCGAFFLAAWFSPLANAQDAAPAAGSVQEELRALRQLVEQQSKQIDALTAQITRLGGELERRNLATPSAPLADSGAKEANAEAAPAAPAARVVAPAGNVHIVVKGDSLDKIAKQHNTTISELQKLNKITDPKKLQIGQQLTLPPAANATPEKKEGQ
jgi:LysM repeat protein